MQGISKEHLKTPGALCTKYSEYLQVSRAAIKVCFLTVSLRADEYMSAKSLK